MALATVEGAVWEALAQDPRVLDQQAAVATFAHLFMATLDG